MVANRACSSGYRPAEGFTLIELMVTVAIVAILATIAYPAYSDYVTRGKLVDATQGLSNLRAQMERHFQDDRSYLTVNSTTPCDATWIASNNINTANFTFSCPTLTATTYTILATGVGGVAGFNYTIDYNGTMATNNLAAWGGTANGCWITRKGGTC